jgi:hypothetical protein
MVKKTSRNASQKSTAPKARGKQVKPNRAGNRKVIDRNVYLESLLNPESSVPAKVPDDTITPSVCLQTRGLVDVITDDGGNALFAFAPAYVAGSRAGSGSDQGADAAAIRMGTDANGNLTLLDDSSTGLPLGWTGAEAVKIMSDKLQTEIRTTFSAIRPVSACLKVSCTEAALTAHGTHFGGRWARGQSPCVPLPSGMSSDFKSYFADGNGPVDMDEAASGAVQLTNFTSNMCVNWAPQDGSDHEYQLTEYGTRSSGAFWRSEWDAGATLVWSPFIIQLNDGTNPGEPQSAEINPESSLPYLVYGVRGATAASHVCTLEFTVNWEAIPIATESRLVSGTPSPANPNELAQASNTMALLPPVQQKSVPGDVPTKMYEAAAKSSDHLYDDKKSTKKATEGTSWLDDIFGFVSDNWSTIASVGGALLGLL